MISEETQEYYDLKKRNGVRESAKRIRRQFLRYDIKKDPAEYCQTCGKPCKDGQNGTCVVFNEDVTCPHCGKTVKAWECHSCD